MVACPRVLVWMSFQIRAECASNPLAALARGRPLSVGRQLSGLT